MLIFLASSYATYDYQSPLHADRREEGHYRREDDNDRRSTSSARYDDGYGSRDSRGRYEAPRSKT
jgi:hypothetical protein